MNYTTKQRNGMKYSATRNHLIGIGIFVALIAAATVLSEAIIKLLR